MIRLIDAYAQRFSHQQSILQWAGIAGTVGFPLFYVLYTQHIVQTYENLPIRCVAMILCAGMALRRYWPERWLRYYYVYAYVCLIYCLPFFHVYMTLKNDGGIAFISDSLMALSFLVLLMDWRNTLVMTIIGASLGWGLYCLTTDIPVWPAEYAARLPTMVLILIGGNLFKLSERHLEAERIKARTMQVRLDAQTALAGSIAHEMRNPLSQVRHSLEQIGENLPDPTRYTESEIRRFADLDTIFRHVAQGKLAIERGLQVIEMTLDEVQAKPLDTAAFIYLSAADTTRKAVEEYSFETDDERQRVSVIVRQDFYFRGDETVFLFVLFNLLKNALYYFRAYPHATLTLTVDHNVVAVRDTGPGIPAAQQTAIFEAFRSAGKIGGTGLGLAYCQRAMQAFGGTITCNSVEGEFTEFSLRFPLVSSEALQAHEQNIMARAAKIFDGKRVLVVDDEIHLRAMPCRVLGELGARVEEASTGLEALDKVRHTPFDLIVMDLNMPVLDGYAATEQIRTVLAARSRSVHIVAYTSETSYVAKEKMRRAGMAACIAKPCRAVDFVRALQEAWMQATVESPATVLRERIILVADDEHVNRQAVRRYLEEADAFVLEAENGKQVLDVIAGAFPPVDAVVLDLRMPLLDGLETAREIRTRDWAFRDLPIIALTGFADDARRQAAHAAGISNVLIKPVQASDLTSALGRCLGAGESTARDAPTRQPDHAVSPGVRSGIFPGVSPAMTTDEKYPLVSRDQLQHFKDFAALEDLASIVQTLELRWQSAREGVSTQNLGQVREALHSMLGLYGLIGAEPMRDRIRHIYTPLECGGTLPRTPDWIGQIEPVMAATREAVEDYLQANGHDVRQR